MSRLILSPVKYYHLGFEIAVPSKETAQRSKGKRIDPMITPVTKNQPSDNHTWGKFHILPGVRCETFSCFRCLQVQDIRTAQTTPLIIFTPRVWLLLFWTNASILSRIVSVEKITPVGSYTPQVWFVLILANAKDSFQAWKKHSCDSHLMWLMELFTNHPPNTRCLQNTDIKNHMQGFYIHQWLV